MQADPTSGKVTATVEKLALYNMLLTKAIFELLAEKGVLDGEEVKERITKLKKETKVNLQRLR